MWPGSPPPGASMVDGKVLLFIFEIVQLVLLLAVSNVILCWDNHIGDTILKSNVFVL